MSNNKKNELQVLCQRSNIPLPVYEQHRDDMGKWVSTVTFIWNDNMKQFTGSGCDRKKQADISAAATAMDTLELDCMSTAKVSMAVADDTNVIITNRSHTLSDFCDTASAAVDTGMYVLIDYENVNKIQHLHYNFRHADADNVRIFKFLGYSHHKVDTDEASHIVHSGGSDAVDHAISMFVGMITKSYKDQHISRKEPPFIIILSKDQFAERLHNLARTDSLEVPIIIHLPSEVQCVDFLRDHGYIQTQQRIAYKG